MFRYHHQCFGHGSFKVSESSCQNYEAFQHHLSRADLSVVKSSNHLLNRSLLGASTRPGASESWKAAAAGFESPSFQHMFSNSASMVGRMPGAGFP